jgi:hypothetical protein
MFYSSCQSDWIISIITHAPSSQTNGDGVWAWYAGDQSEKKPARKSSEARAHYEKLSCLALYSVCTGAKPEVVRGALASLYRRKERNSEISYRHCFEPACLSKLTDYTKGQTACRSKSNIQRKLRQARLAVVDSVHRGAWEPLCQSNKYILLYLERAIVSLFF